MGKYSLFLVFVSLTLTLEAQIKHQVTANPNNTFSPSTLNIEVGDTVSWTNNGGFHNVNGSVDAYAGNPEGFGNGDASSGAWTYEFVFNTSGVYNYHCDPHLTLGMTGSITVNTASGGVVISEIMYNPPGSDADLEYLELYNAGDNAVNLLGYSFFGFTFTFPGFNLGAGDYVIIAADSAFFRATFGVQAFQREGGGLNNGGELIQLLDASGAVIDQVDYEPDGAWPVEADGLGAALVLCDPDADNEDPANWDAATTPTGVEVGGFALFANPGAAAQCATGPTVAFAIADQTLNENAGTLMIPLILERGDAGSTTMVDVGVGTGSSATLDSDFSFTPGTVTFTPGAVTDTVMLSLGIIDDAAIETLDTIILELSNPSAEASIDIFRGTLSIIIQDNDASIPDLAITEIMYNPPESDTDSLEFVEIYNRGNEPVDLEGYTFSDGISFTFPAFSLPAKGYVVVATNGAALSNLFNITAFDAEGALSNGGELIQLLNPGGSKVIEVTYSDDPPWPAQADGDGPSLVLCDPTADPADGANWAASTTATGITVNGQAIFASPGAADACAPPEEVVYPPYDISALKSVNEAGIADSIGVRAQISGIVYGVNLRPDGLQFTLIDNDQFGIGVFSDNQNFGYSVQEGDEVQVRGTIGQFNGFTQINVDTLMALSSNNALLNAAVVNELSEATESQLVKLEAVSLVDPATWKEDGSSFDIFVTNGLDTFLVRIDDDVDIAGTAAPAGPFNLTGLGGQFDLSEPFTDGYQIVPRYLADIELISNTLDPELAENIRFYPNPSHDFLQVDLSESFDVIRLHNALGQGLLEIRRPQWQVRLDLRTFANGIYTLTFVQGNRLWSTRIVKQ